MTYLPLDHARGRAIPDSAIQTLWWTDTSIKAIGAIWSVKGVNDVSKRYVPWSEYDFPSIREWDYKSIFMASHTPIMFGFLWWLTKAVN